MDGIKTYNMNRREALKTTFFSALMVAVSGLPGVLSSGESRENGITIKMDTVLLRQGDIIMNADSEQFLVVRKDGKWQAIGLRTKLVINIEHMVETEEGLIVPEPEPESKEKPYVVISSAFSEKQSRSEFEHYEDDSGISCISLKSKNL